MLCENEFGIASFLGKMTKCRGGSREFNITCILYSREPAKRLIVSLFKIVRVDFAIILEQFVDWKRLFKCI
jgi:hypothetical protein